MNSDKPAPMACTLSATEFKNRAQRLNELTSEALLTHHVEGLSARLKYKADVRQERCCCSFLRFDVTRASDHVELRITAPAEAGNNARALFAHLIPG